MRQRYAENKRVEKLRTEIFDKGIGLFKSGDIKGALDAYKEVRDLEPKNYIGDKLQRITDFFIYSSYNIACCYSKLENEKEALIELEVALNAGWEDYDKVRTDKNLEFVRESNPEKFKEVLERYDEPLFTEG